MFGNPSYPTYQAFLGLGIAAAIALLLMPWWIKLLKVEGIGQQVRADGPKRHLIKQGTPTMGGVIMLIAVIAVALLTIYSMRHETHTDALERMREITV